MDWTMINNAVGPTQRIRTLFYLCKLRYEAKAGSAGTRLADVSPGNRLCQETIAEVRAELASPSANLGPVARVSDKDIRKYFVKLLTAYDERLGRGR
jgi:hypothetical protein